MSTAEIPVAEIGLDGWGPGPRKVRKFSVPEYHRMIEAGVFEDGEPFELLEGLVVPKMPHSPGHAHALELVQFWLGKLIPPEWRPRIQLPITTVDSEPEPDFVIVRGEIGTHRSRHPEASEISLLVEISRTSIVADQREKGRIYARAGIPIYWIVNLIDRQVEIYTDPHPHDAPPTYGHCQILKPGDQAPVVVGEQVAGQIAVSDLLP